MKRETAGGKRRYRQTARARAAEETATRILEAFAARLRADWFDQITLGQVARDAGVTVPTIIRRFGSKEGLLEAAWERMAKQIRRRRTVHAGDPAAAVRAVVRDYEVVGDLVARSLAQEDRYPAIRSANDKGHAHHRAWVEACFAPWLAGLDRAEQRRRLDALVAATDLYLWKLVRRDMGRSRAHVQALMLDLVEGIIGEVSCEATGVQT